MFVKHIGLNKIKKINLPFTFTLPDNELVTVHKCSRMPPPASAHFANRVQRSRVVRLSWSSGFFVRAVACKMRASNSSGVSTFFLHRSSSTREKRGKSSGCWIETIVSWYSEFKHTLMWIFFPQWPILPRPKILTSWITLYVGSEYSGRWRSAHVS